MRIPNCSVCAVLDSGCIPKRYMFVCRLQISIAVMAPNQYYPGRCELWCTAHATELFQLSFRQRQRFSEDLAILAKAIQQVCTPKKINYELLGNTVPHLHWHVIPRYNWDPLPKRPIWENKSYQESARRACMEPSERQRMTISIRDSLRTLIPYRAL